MEIKFTSKFHLPLLIVSGVLFITVLLPWFSGFNTIFNWRVLTLIMSLAGIELAFIIPQNVRSIGSLIAGGLALFGVILFWTTDLRGLGFSFGIILSLLASLGLIAVGVIDFLQIRQPFQTSRPAPAGQPIQPSQPPQPGQPVQQGQPTQPSQPVQQGQPPRTGQPVQPGQPIRPSGTVQFPYIDPIKLVLLSIVTFGIYAIIWFVNMKDRLNSYGTKIPTAWFLIIPVLNIYWLWKFCEGLEFVTSKRIEGIMAFLLLGFLSVIGLFIVQDNLNKFSGSSPQTPPSTGPSRPTGPSTTTGPSKPTGPSAPTSAPPPPPPPPPK